MKKLKIVGFILLFTIVILNVCSILSFAASPIDNPGFWKPTQSTDTTLNDKIGGILGVIQVIGVLVSVIVLMVLGIKYMLGSAEEKAINKKAMIPYLVGAVMVFSVTTIPNFVYQFTNGIFNPPITCESGHSYSESGKCRVCGAPCRHTGWYDDSQFAGTNIMRCAVCSYGCDHRNKFEYYTDSKHICSVCNYTQDHDILNDEHFHNYCAICDSTIE